METEGPKAPPPLEVLDAISEAIVRPGFKEDWDTQMWAVGGFAKFRYLAKEEYAKAMEDFCAVTSLPDARLLHLLDMARDDPHDPRDPVEVFANIRSSLKATRTELGPSLPGEDIFPRNGFIGAYVVFHALCATTGDQ